MKKAKRFGLYLLRSGGGLLLVLWVAASITFVVLKLIPGDPVAVLSGGENVVDEAGREAIRHRFGLDKPVPLQYLSYIGAALSGNLGASFQFRQPVLAVIGQAFGPTFQLAGSAIAVALVLALLAAVSTAGYRGAWRPLVGALELILLSTPVYWIGIVLLAVFSFQLHWFPVTGGTGFRSLVLPVCALALPLAALVSQVLRDALEHALGQPFAQSVRARGVGEGALRVHHALRHAAVSSSTLSATLFASVLGGSVLTETVFGRPGIGQITLLAIRNRDTPLILGLVMLSALIFVVVNAVVDALYLLIDPRLRRRAA